MRNLLEPVAIESEKTRLFSADQSRVRGNVDLGYPLLAFNPVDTRVSDHGVKKTGAILVGFRCLGELTQADAGFGEQPLRVGPRYVSVASGFFS